MRIFMLLAALLVIPATASAQWIDTSIDEDERKVTVWLQAVPGPYTQIAVDEVVGLDWCSCIYNRNPRSLDFTAFTISATTLEIEYRENPPPRQDNFIEWHYGSAWHFTGKWAYADDLITISTEAGEVKWEGMVPILTYAGTDTDEDGVIDFFDNCRLHANPSQLDTDADGFGNRCDADFDQDNIVAGTDFGELIRFFNSTSELHDLDEDGIVAGTDVSILFQLFNKAPGPTLAQ